MEKRSVYEYPIDLKDIYLNYFPDDKDALTYQGALSAVDSLIGIACTVTTLTSSYAPSGLTFYGGLKPTETTEILVTTSTTVDVADYGQAHIVTEVTGSTSIELNSSTLSTTVDITRYTEAQINWNPTLSVTITTNTENLDITRHKYVTVNVPDKYAQYIGAQFMTRATNTDQFVFYQSTYLTTNNRFGAKIIEPPEPAQYNGKSSHLYNGWRDGEYNIAFFPIQTTTATLTTYYLIRSEKYSGNTNGYLADYKETAETNNNAVIVTVTGQNEFQHTISASINLTTNGTFLTGVLLDTPSQSSHPNAKFYMGAIVISKNSGLTFPITMTNLTLTTEMIISTTFHNQTFYGYCRMGSLATGNIRSNQRYISQNTYNPTTSTSSFLATIGSQFNTLMTTLLTNFFE